MLSRGHLDDPTQAPDTGERFETLASVRGVVVEHILSSASDVPVRYVQDQDEWVVVLTGAAVVDVDGALHQLGAGDWLLLPAQVPHTVVRTAAATTWLAVHIPPPA